MAGTGAMSRQLDAVVFDFDGTLVDTFPLMLAAFNAACQPYRATPVTREEMVSHFGPGAGTEVPILSILAGRDDPACAEAFYDAYAARHGELCACFPGLREVMLDARAAGCKLGIVTGKGRRSAAVSLCELDLEHLFDAVMTGDDAPAPKPDPRGLLLVLEQLGVPPERALFVGDSEADIGAGRAAGTRTAAACWNEPGDPALLTAQADYYVHSGAALRRLIAELSRGTSTRR